MRCFLLFFIPASSTASTLDLYNCRASPPPLIGQQKTWPVHDKMTPESPVHRGEQLTKKIINYIKDRNPREFFFLTFNTFSSNHVQRVKSKRTGFKNVTQRDKQPWHKQVLRHLVAINRQTDRTMCSQSVVGSFYLHVVRHTDTSCPVTQTHIMLLHYSVLECNKGGCI